MMLVQRLFPTLSIEKLGLTSKDSIMNRDGLFPWLCCGLMVGYMIYTGTMPLLTCACVALVVAMNY